MSTLREARHAFTYKRESLGQVFVLFETVDRVKSQVEVKLAKDSNQSFTNMSSSSSDRYNGKSIINHADIEKQATNEQLVAAPPVPKTLGAGVCPSRERS